MFDIITWDATSGGGRGLVYSFQKSKKYPNFAALIIPI